MQFILFDINKTLDNSQIIPEIGHQRVAEATEKQVARSPQWMPYWRISDQVLQPMMETDFLLENSCQ